MEQELKPGPDKITLDWAEERLQKAWKNPEQYSHAQIVEVAAVFRNAYRRPSAPADDLREAKAQAFEEAAAYHQAWCDDLKSQSGYPDLPGQKEYFRIHELDAYMFRNKAAALRQPAPSSKVKTGDA